MKPCIKFEPGDWEEIVEALASKIAQIQNGQLGPEDFPGQDKKWIAHLRRIIRKIEGKPGKKYHLDVFKKKVFTE